MMSSIHIAMTNVQLRSSWQFFCKGSCTSTFRSLNRIKRYNHNIFGFRECHRPYVLSIVECYQNRTDMQQHVSEHGTLSVVPRKEDVFHVVLTVRPDEFHKLPPKCSACGAIFQTKHDKQAGYINEKKFVDALKTGVSDKLVCFNCYRLRYHNSPVLKGVDSIDAMNQLHHLREQKALILYVVDLFDIEGTMLSNILQLVGEKKRVIIVGNKLDRIPLDYQKPLISKQFSAMKSAVKDIAFKNGLNESCNFRDICLVSAKTGFGLKTLVEQINEHRDKYMNVYLVGCTNTGKSTLYNLLVNLINVHKSNDLPAQAIEHHLPGTTMSLVRESISQSKLRKLVKRLEKGPYVSENVFNFDDEFLDFLNVDKKDKRYQIMDAASKNDHEKRRLLGQRNMMEPRPVEVVDEKSIEKEEKSCFIYDTPGILNTSQLIQYLTPSEINYLSPSLWVVPRTFLLKPGYCICVGGLARLDFLSITRPPLIENGGAGKVDLSHDVLLHSGQGIYVTVMISPNVPIHVTTSEIAKEKYETWFSNNFFKLPVGSPERFKDFPKLMQHDYTILGKSRNTNACDLVLHGIGWLSVAAVWGSKVCLALHTPNGDGQNLRHRPFLPYTVQKKQGRGVMYYGRLNRNMYGHTRKRSPQLIKLLEEKNETPDTIQIWKAKIKGKMKQERFQKKENERLERIEQGIVLGKRKTLMEKEQKFRLLEEQSHSKLLEIKK